MLGLIVACVVAFIVFQSTHSWAWALLGFFGPALFVLICVGGVTALGWGAPRRP